MSFNASIANSYNKYYIDVETKVLHRMATKLNDILGINCDSSGCTVGGVLKILDYEMVRSAVRDRLTHFVTDEKLITS